MKEQTKNRLKRIGSIAVKVVTYGLASFGLVCAIAMASGGCAPKDRNAEASSVRKVNTKLAPDYGEAENLVDPSLYGKVAMYRNGDELAMDYAVNWWSYKIRMDSTKLYYVHWETTDPLFAYFTLLKGDNDFSGNYVDIVNGETTSARPDISHVSIYVSATANRSGGYYVSNVDGSFPWLALTFATGDPDTGRTSVSVTCVDMMAVTATNTFVLPDNWNPYQLRGGTPNEYGYGTYSENGTPTTWYNGFIFRSAGYLWNAIGFEVIDMQNNYVGYYDAGGVLRYHLITEANQQLINRVCFAQHNPIPASWNGGSPTTNWVMTCPKVWVPELENPRSEGVLGAWVYLPKEPHQWSDPAFRTLEVLDVTSETWQASTQTAPAPTLEWLRRTFADETYFDPNQWVEGTYSPFTLIGNAFGSVVSLFSVMVLPGITLGLIIVLPLIAGIIVLIIKAVSK